MKQTKKFLFLIAMTLLLASCTYEGDKIVKIQELPNNEIYEMDGQHVDLGIAFKQDGIDLGFKLPYHNYGDPHYVLFYKSKWDDTYDWHSYTLDQEEVQYFVDLYGIESTPKIPFRHRAGAVIISVLLIVFGIVGIGIKIRDWLS